MKTHVCLIALCLISATAVAEIGETRAEIFKQFGVPLFKGHVNGDFKRIEYESKGLIIEVKFTNPERGEVSVVGTVTYTSATDKELSDEEITQLLSRNAAGSKWVRQEKYDFKVWRLENGKADAWYKPFGSRQLALTISSEITIDILAESFKKALNREAEAKKLRQEQIKQLKEGVK